MSIADDVLEDAKRRAAEEGRTLGELITEALRLRLARRAPAGAARFEAVTYGEGGIVPGVDITDNASVRERMDAG